ncbi:hypothetical protein BN134_3025 [Cronobacter dublinensis 1210]|uniref:Uncharacterized protein n=1 Tax=Cronobacter dublinensis 1210 TaxID=1208656 RepID=A0ABM9Q9V3_9ENTR|nr:hypothetical protein BN134_3025 [Cronobacter dublinensis 1210]
MTRGRKGGYKLRILGWLTFLTGATGKSVSECNLSKNGQVSQMQNM